MIFDRRSGKRIHAVRARKPASRLNRTIRHPSGEYERKDSLMRFATLLLVAGVSACLIAAGGCVSADEYNKAVAASRRANEELLKCQEARAALRADNERLTRELSSRDAIIKSAQDQIALLEQNIASLQDSYSKLKDLYDQATKGQLPVPLAGPLLGPELDKLLQEFAAKYPDLVEYLPKYGMVKFKADLTFEKGSDAVSAGAADALKRFAEIINGPVATRFNIYIAGHTDDIPIKRPETIRLHPTNWHLSVHRSLAVIKVLTEAGVAQPRMGSMGFSKYHPVEANAPGEKGNPKNRRVEIWIVPPDRFLTGAMDEASAGGEVE